jgi:2-phospho-L-lactate guanylyltransferase (CobY/MobA/RfbA family)
LRPVDGFRPPFGVPAEETLASARAAGLESVVIDDPRLALDIDRPEDYELLLART